MNRLAALFSIHISASPCKQGDVNHIDFGHA